MTLTAPSPRLHLRLLVLVLLLLCVGWLGLWLYLSTNVSETAARDVDRQLNQAAFSLLLGWREGQAAAGGDETVVDPAQATLPEFELRSESGEVLVQSRRFPLSDTQSQALEAGFSQPTINGIQWRVLTLRDSPNGRFARVAVPLEAVAQRDSELASAFVTPLLLALPVLGILVSLGIWQALRPLRQIAEKVSETEVDCLEPLAIDLRGVPREMQPPVLAINRLIRRVRQAMVSHRAFTSAMGHELRTPLAGFKSQVQVALRSEQREDKDRSLNKLAAAIDGMERLVDHLLILARVDPVQSRLKMEQVDLSALAEQSLAERESRMQAKALKPELESSGASFSIEGDATLIGSLIGNLLDNAIRYSPTGGRVLVRIDSAGDGCECRVSDQGPGISDDQQADVFENFYREPDQRKTGSGLGLGIVRAVALAHGGSVEIVDGPQEGLCVRVWLPKKGTGSVQTAVR